MIEERNRLVGVMSSIFVHLPVLFLTCVTQISMRNKLMNPQNPMMSLNTYAGEIGLRIEDPGRTLCLAC